MKHRSRRSALVLGVLWLLIADVATAGSYTLVVGKGSRCVRRTSRI